MKLHLIVFAFLMIAGSCNAVPQISQLTASRSEIWLGDPINLTARCMDNDTQVSKVLSDLIGPGTILPALNFEPAGENMYLLQIPGNYFDRKGNYTANVTCIGSGETSAEISFSVSDVISRISKIQSMLYAEDVLEIQMMPKKNDILITQDVTFRLIIDGQEKQLLMPPFFDSQRGWILRSDSPNTGNHSVLVETNYLDKIMKNSASLEVRQLVSLDILSIEKTNVKTQENVSITFRATSHGDAIALNKDNIRIYCGGTNSKITDFYQSSGNYNVKFETPDLSSGSYNMRLEINFNGSTYSAETGISYLKTIIGRFTDSSGNGISVSMRFFKGDSQKFSASTNSDGTYNLQILPDTYNMDAEFPDAFIHLDNVEVTGAVNPITYSYNPNAKSEGLVISGMFYMSTQWHFESATLKLKYRDIFEKESTLKVYKCALYDNGCSSSWTTITPEIDGNINTATIYITSLSNFAVGTLDSLNITLNTDKQKYQRKELIKISGSTFTSQGPIGNVQVMLRMPGIGQDALTTSDPRGYYSKEIISPDQDGNYSILAEASKSPFQQISKSGGIEIVSSPSISIIFPGSIRVEKGGNFTEEIKIVNTGQTDITNAQISIDLDKSHYLMAESVFSIKEKQEIRIPATFFAGDNDASNTISASINFTSDQISSKKIFGFTIQDKQTEGIPKTAMATSNPIQISEILNAGKYVASIGSAMIFAVILIRKAKKRPQTFSQYRAENFGQSTNSQYLQDIKNYLESKNRPEGAQ
jgi:hypothetical protein